MASREALSLQERKEKRQSRRERQRAENAGRAQKMHEARIESGSAPVEKPALKRRCYIGCSGWFYWGWQGIFYPNEIPTSKWFEHYAKNFDTVELNAPFYSWPAVTTVKTWLRQAKRADFVYTIKANELITHSKRFEETNGLIEDFGYIADLLGNSMGCILYQLPPSFKYTPERLKNILRQLQPNRRNVVEFRHASWWNEKVYNAFRKNGVIFCSCSGPRLPDELVQAADEIYIRFHGTEKWYRHDYSDKELAVWAERIRNCDARHVWVYFNNDAGGHAIRNAKMLGDLLS